MYYNQQEKQMKHGASTDGQSQMYHDGVSSNN